MGHVKGVPHRDVSVVWCWMKAILKDPPRLRHTTFRILECYLGAGAAVALLWYWPSPWALLIAPGVGAFMEFFIYEFGFEPWGLAGPYWERGPQWEESYKETGCVVLDKWENPPE